MQSLIEVDFNSAIDVLSTYANRGADMTDWLKDAQLNFDRNLRLQYLARAGPEPVHRGRHIQQHDRNPAVPGQHLFVTDSLLYEQALREAIGVVSSVGALYERNHLLASGPPVPLTAKDWTFTDRIAGRGSVEKDSWSGPPTPSTTRNGVRS